MVFQKHTGALGREMFYQTGAAVCPGSQSAGLEERKEEAGVGGSSLPEVLTAVHF